MSIAIDEKPFNVERIRSSNGSRPPGVYDRMPNNGDGDELRSVGWAVPEINR
jgi:hypothetical protein